MRKIAIAITVFAAALTSVAAWAGGKYYYGVGVGSTYAYGSLGEARSSSDANAQIGCQTINNQGSTPQAICYAQTTAGGYKSCTTTDPNIVAEARTIGPISYLYFSWNSSGTCTYLYQLRGSGVLPVTP